MRFPQRPQQDDGLLRRLAGAEDDFWIAGASHTIGVQSRKSEVAPANVVAHRPTVAGCWTCVLDGLGAPRLTRVPIRPRPDLATSARGHVHRGGRPDGSSAEGRWSLSDGSRRARRRPPGEVDGAVVPVESSVEGSVNATLDELIRGEPLVISGEVLLPVSMALMARPGPTSAPIRQIVTHPVAEAQCRRWVAAKLPGARIIVTTFDRCGRSHRGRGRGRS